MISTILCRVKTWWSPLIRSLKSSLDRSRRKSSKRIFASDLAERIGGSSFRGETICDSTCVGHAKEMYRIARLHAGPKEPWDVRSDLAVCWHAAAAKKPSCCESTYPPV